VFVSMSGLKAEYHYLTLYVIREFNEWRVLLRGPEVIAHGARQFSEDKAKEHAVAVAQYYIRDYKREDLPAVSAVEWTPTSQDDWLVWHA
jgi:hypothetical protein